jgi:hypothetical protein
VAGGAGEGGEGMSNNEIPKFMTFKELLSLPLAADTVPDDPLTLENIQKRFPVLFWVFYIADEHVDSDWWQKCRVYSALKKISSQFVGWESQDERYSTSKAFDLVITEILDRMRM